MCVLNGGFMRLGLGFSRFGHDVLLEKIFLVAWDKIVFRQSRFFFYFFFYSMFL